MEPNEPLRRPRLSPMYSVMISLAVGSLTIGFSLVHASWYVWLFCGFCWSAALFASIQGLQHITQAFFYYGKYIHALEVREKLDLAADRAFLERIQTPTKTPQ